MKPKYAILSLAVTIFLAGPGMARADLDTVWTRTCGGTANDGLRSACLTSDGCFTAVGYTYSFGPNEVNIYLVKVDTEGDTLWTRAIGGSGRDYGYGICEGYDGGCMITGYTTSSGEGREDVYVASIDAAGGVVWARTYGGAGSDEGRALCKTGDGHFIVAGRTDSFGAGQSDVYVLKLEADGDTVWTRVFGGIEYDWGESVCETADGCYCIAGTAGSNSASRDIYLIKIDADGSTLWQRYYGDFSTWISHDWGSAVCPAADSGLVVTGNRIINQVDPDEVYFLRTDALGNQTALRRYYGSFIEYGCSICETPDAGYLICGIEKNETTLKNDLLLVKRIPGTGWVWEQVIGGAGSDWGSSVVQVAPGQYLIAGHTECSGAGGYDGWLLRMKEPQAGAASAAPAALQAVPSPNPFETKTTICFTVPSRSPVEIAIYDVAGRRVRLLAQGWRDEGEHTAVWDGRDQYGRQVAPGIYVVRIAAGDVSGVSKVVLLSD